MVSRLVLSLKREWFEAIRNGSKREEYRLATPFWIRRLDGRRFDEIEFTLGYPSASDSSRRLRYSCTRIERRWIRHPFFGTDPVEVFVIGIGERI